MNRELIINVTSTEINIALCEDKVLVELGKDMAQTGFSVGDIYLGKVRKIMPGLNAAFVNIGHERDAFIHYQDLGPHFPSLDKVVDSWAPGKKCIRVETMKIDSALEKDGKIVRKGVVDSGDEVEVDFGGLSSGIYSFVLKMSVTAPNGVSVTSEQKLSIVRIREGEAVPDGLENVFTVVSEDEPFVRIGVGRGPVWAVVELFDGTGRRLHADMLELKAGESRYIRYAPVNETADAVIMNILYFRNSECHAFSHIWHRRSDRQDMPLEIVKLTDESSKVVLSI